MTKESQPTGMARIINQFSISDPIKQEEIEMVRNHFAKFHSETLHHCKLEKVETLIGCSGAFDTIADIIDCVNPGEKLRRTQEISINSFYGVYNNLLKSTREDRLAMTGMDFVRVDLIVPAVILIEFLVSENNIKEIIQTDFALREGVFYDLIKHGH